jgi:hypothetical protein
MITFKQLFTRAMIWNDIPVSWENMTMDSFSINSPPLLEEFIVTNDIAVFGSSGSYCISTRLGSFVMLSNMEFFIFEDQVPIDELFLLLNTDELMEFHDWYNIYPMHPSIEHQTTTGDAHYGIYNSVDAGIYGETEVATVGQAIEKARTKNKKGKSR